MRTSDQSGKADGLTPAGHVEKELARTVQELSRSERALTALMHGSKALLEQKGFPGPARAIFDRCMALIGATSGYVALLDTDSMESELVFLEPGGQPCEVDPSLPMPISGMHAQACSMNKPVYHNDFMNSAWAGRMPAGHAALKNVMLAPILLDGKTVGIMAMANKQTDFDPNDASLAAGFGRLTAIALQNSRNQEIVSDKAKALEQAIQDLDNSQALLIQSEKMASLGQLAAGVAHEINNPTGFISSNLKTLLEYQNDLSRLMEQYRTFKDAVNCRPEASSPSIRELITQIEDTEKEIDIDYLCQDVGDLIGECCEGADRIKKIVEDLKHFAHPGQDKVQDTDINRELESTLNVVNNELKYKATVIKELGSLPVISANPQQLSQVFVNILVNAAQAIEKSGEIRIQTQQVDGHVQIRISDTGCGISPENIGKIFDPFFTTKAVGKGTGLGMNIAYNIIKKHQGDIHVDSRVGQGTSFLINLPVRLLDDGQ